MLFSERGRPITAIKKKIIFYSGNETTKPLKSFSDAAVVVVAGNDWLVTLTKARPTHKHSQHSHTLSPLTGAWFMDGLFAELSLEV